MKNIIKLEEIAQFLFCIYIFSLLLYDWWVFPVLLLLPDIGILGYVINPKTGALTYNIFHHKGIAIFVGVLGMYFGLDSLVLAGVILYAHSAFDRMFGYGLKFQDSFSKTHLGKIGRK